MMEINVKPQIPDGVNLNVNLILDNDEQVMEVIKVLRKIKKKEKTDFGKLIEGD